MKPENDRPASGFGLAATGSCRRWDIAVDEALDGEELSLEIEGPQTYLVFQLRSPQAISEALRFLQAGPGSPRAKGGQEERALHLGRFGSAAVSLLWDNESFPRCFLVVGPRARSTLRLTFEEEDIQMISEALLQVLKDLSVAVGE